MKLLVIRFSSLGDCVLLCPFFAHARRAGAEEIVVLTKRAYADLFASATGVDRVIALDGEYAGTRGLLRAGSEFRDSGHVIIDAHASLRSRVVAWRAGGAAACIRKHTRERLDLIVFKRAAPLPSMLQRYAALLEPAGLPAAVLAPGGLTPGPEATAAARRNLPDHDTIAVAPGSRWISKRWTGYTQMCDALARAGHTILLVGDAHDRALTAPIAERLGDRALDIAGKMPLMHTAAHIARCRLFVGNDSGLMHLAEAVGVPVVAAFGPTVEAFGYFPSLPASRVVERQIACRPCSRNGSTPCPRGTHECLTAIAPAAMLETIDHALAGTGPRRVTLR